MTIEPLPLEGTFLLRSELKADNRGYFARMFCEESLAKHGLETHFPQSSISFNHKRGTLRGLHFQTAPHAEIKIVRAVSGRVFDVMVDLRPQSKTYKQHLSVELDAEQGNAVYIPKGFAHGFQTLTDGATLLYYCSENFNEGSATGVNYLDPAFNISWPITSDVTIAERDKALPFSG